MASEISPGSNTALPAPVLGYAQYQQQWDRGVMWLLGIVCVTQLLTLPAVAFRLWSTAQSYAYARPAWLSAPLIERSEAGISIALELVINPLFSLLVAILAFFALVRPLTGRRVLRLVAWANVWTLAIAALGQLDRIFPYPSGGVVPVVSAFAVSAYPLILLALVLRQHDGMRKRVSAWGIWWLSAGACMLLALPTALDWTLRFESFWDETVVDFVGWRIDGDWMRTIKGIGEITGAMACFSAFAVTLWTILKGPKGRWALMICAALLVVKAAAVNGQEIVAGGIDLMRYRNTAWRWLSYELAALGGQLTGFALAMAFPLAVRMALSLSEVRTRLDGVTAGESSESENQRPGGDVAPLP